MVKQYKKDYVKNLSEKISMANSVVLVDYSGLNVGLQQELKAKLTESGATMLVVKNTLFKLAGKGAKLDNNTLTDTVLSGQTALILANEDPIAPLQILAKFSKENDVPQLKVGIVEGKFQDSDNLKVLSELPSKEVLVGQAVGAIASPLYGIVGVLNANMQKLVYVLKQASKEA